MMRHSLSLKAAWRALNPWPRRYFWCGRPPAWYAGAYFALIPLFAALYTPLRHHFVYPVATNEWIVKRDTADILNNLREDAVDWFIEFHRRSTMSLDHVVVDVATLKYDDASIRDDRLTFTVAFQLTLKEKELPPPWWPERQTTVLVLGRVHLENGYGQAILADSTERAAVIARFEEGSRLLTLPWRDLFRIVFPARPSQYANINQNEVILLVRSQRPELLRRLLEIGRGNAQYASQEFPRMLYFSVVTITTLGYGDIVPTSIYTRGLVALEASLGLVVAGLFVNAAAQRSDPRPTQHDAPRRRS